MNISNRSNKNYSRLKRLDKQRLFNVTDMPPTPHTPKYQIHNHGPDMADTFPGYGTIGTRFNNVAVGLGDNAKEAYEDALDQAGFLEADTSIFPANPRGIRRTDCLTADEREAEGSWYVIVRW